MRLPSRKNIIARALDHRADAQQQRDTAAVRQLDRLIANLYSGMKMRWDADGALIIRSCNTPGAAYATTATRCSCPAHVAFCCHRRLYDLLIELFETDVETADMRCDPPGPNPLGEEEGDAPPERERWHIGALMARRMAATA